MIRIRVKWLLATPAWLAAKNKTQELEFLSSSPEDPTCKLTQC